MTDPVGPANPGTGELAELLQKHQQELLRYEYVLNALSDIGDELCRVTSFDQQLKSLLHLLMGTLGVSKGGIFIFEPSTGSMLLRCAWKLSCKTAAFKIDQKERETLEQINEPLTFASNQLPFLRQINEHFATDNLGYFTILKVREKLIGLVVVGQRLQKASFDEKQINFLTTLSRNIAVAINNFLLLQELRETNNRLDEKIQEVSVLYQATQMIASELQLQGLLEMAIDATSEITEVASASIWLYEEEKSQFVLKVHRGAEGSMPEELSIERSRLAREIIQRKEPVRARYAADAVLEPDQSADLACFGASFVAVPILHGGEFLGMMHLCQKSNDKDFSERDLRLTTVFAVQLGAAVKNAKLYEQAITDGMTKLYLHRYFKQKLYEELKRAERYNRPLSVVMIDIDYFKRFNDTYGHQLGDEVLKRVANTLRKSVRTHDLAARYGGEEFALILPDTDLTGAITVAERIRRAVEIDYLEHEHQTIKVTVSLGVSLFPEHAGEVETLIKAADQALYISKEGGRNRVSFLPLPESDPSAPDGAIPPLP